MPQHTRPAEFLCSLTLNLTIIALATASLSQLLPRSLSLFAKNNVIQQTLEQTEKENLKLEQQIILNKQKPLVNLNKVANLSHQNSVHLFWETEKDSQKSEE